MVLCSDCDSRKESHAFCIRPVPCFLTKLNIGTTKIKWRNGSSKIFLYKHAICLDWDYTWCDAMNDLVVVGWQEFEGVENTGLETRGRCHWTIHRGSFMLPWSNHGVNSILSIPVLVNSKIIPIPPSKNQFQLLLLIIIFKKKKFILQVICFFTV